MIIMLRRGGNQEVKAAGSEDRLDIFKREESVTHASANSFDMNSNTQTPCTTPIKKGDNIRPSPLIRKNNVRKPKTGLPVVIRTEVAQLAVRVPPVYAVRNNEIISNVQFSFYDENAEESIPAIVVPENGFSTPPVNTTQIPRREALMANPRAPIRAIHISYPTDN